jgi:hypothetical protein
MTRQRLATAIVSLAFLLIIGLNLRAMYLESSREESRSSFILMRKASVEPTDEPVLTATVSARDASIISCDAGLPEPDDPDAGKAPSATLSHVSDGGVDLITTLLNRWGEARAEEPDPL